mgnify:CR=1 FL=1
MDTKRENPLAHIYEGERGNLPNLYSYFGINQKEKSDAESKLHQTDSRLFPPNQFYALKNIENWLKLRNNKISKEFFNEFDNYFIDPYANADFLKKLIAYGSNKKDITSRYALWTTEVTGTVCAACDSRIGTVYDLFHEPDTAKGECQCQKYYFGGIPTPKRYFVVVFAGINTPEGTGYIIALGEEIKKQLLQQAPHSTVDIMYIYAYDDSGDENVLNDGIIGDSMQVYSRIFDPKSKPPWNFSYEIINKHQGKYDYMFFAGHSGGGVMASRVAEVLDQIDNGPYVNKIIRIGSPELNMGPAYQDRTFDLIIPMDPVPLLKFRRTDTDKAVKNIYLSDMAYDTLDPVVIHRAYFQHNCTDVCRQRCAEDVKKGNDKYYYPENPNNVTNMEKTVRAFMPYID